MTWQHPGIHELAETGYPSKMHHLHQDRYHRMHHCNCSVR